MCKAFMAAAVLVVCLGCVALPPSDGGAADPLERASVIYVVDGDTVCVQRDSAEGPEKVRLIGVDSPETEKTPDGYLERTGKDRSAEGEAASAHTRELLPEGAGIWLQFDAESEDDYGRILAYVWLEEPDDPFDESEVSEKMLNAELLIGGWAEPMAVEPNTAYEALFQRLAA